MGLLDKVDNLDESKPAKKETKAGKKENKKEEKESDDVFDFEEETLEFEYAFDYINNKQLFIVDVNASRCFGHGVNETIH